MTGRVVTIIRALWYSGLAVAFIAGVPWALVHVVGSPLPSRVPDGVLLRDWIDHPFTGMRPWKAASIVVWLLWASVVYLLAAALLRQAGRRRPARLQLRPIEAVAAGMVGATTAVVSTAGAQATPPAAASAAPQTPAPSAMDAHRTSAALAVGEEPSYVVQQGDWLSAIAGRFLGDRDAYPRLVELNPQLAVRGANHIEPGWRLQLPAEAVDHGIRLHATGPYTSSTTAKPEPPPEPTPAQPPRPEATDEPVPEPTTPDDHLAEDPDDGAPDYEVSHTNGALAGAGLLSAVMFAMLMAERRRQRTWLAAGEEPPRPRSGRAERELRAAQQPADVERLDSALRDLGARLAGRPLPDIVGVRLVGGDVQVLLATAEHNPPEPWLDEGTQWALPAYIEPAQLDQQPPMLPLLVTIGSRAGRHLLIDLDRLGTLAITGDPGSGRDLLRHLVCELACAAWSVDVTVILAGFGDEATQISDIAPGRVHAVPTVADAGTILAAGRADSTNSARTAAVLAVAHSDPAARTALANLHAAAGVEGGVAVVVLAGDAPPAGAAVLDAQSDGTVTIDVPGLRLTTDAAYVPVDMLEPMAQLFRVARLTRPAHADEPDPDEDVLAIFDPTTLEPELPPPDLREPELLDTAGPSTQDDGHAPGQTVTDRRLDEPDPSLDNDLAAWQRANLTRPRLGILGPILIHLPGELTDSRHRFLTELLLYLLTRPDQSASRAQIEDALWYGNPAPTGSLRASIVRLRRWLGPRDDGLPWIPDGTAHGAYRLTDGVLLDWHLLLRLRERATRRGDAGHADRRAALAVERR